MPRVHIHIGLGGQRRLNFEELKVVDCSRTPIFRFLKNGSIFKPLPHTYETMHVITSIIQMIQIQQLART
jgi:hypothetical protein